MNTWIVILFAIVVAAQATPFYGEGGPGMDYSSGDNYGNSGYGAGRRGFFDRLFHNRFFRNRHNIGHHQDDYDASVHHHQEADHNIGGVMEGSNGGQNDQGYSGYRNGHNMYGNRWNQGYGY